MCTLSIFKKPDGFRIFMNRDERHDRPAELPPRILQSKNAVFGPLDPVSDGTWIAYNEHGFWGCVLNGYFEEQDNRMPLNAHASRGRILLELLSQDDPLSAAENFNATGYLSFRLLVGSSTQCALYEWNGTTYAPASFHAQHNNQAFLLSSSSWQQDNVIKIRKALFEDWVSKHADIPDDIPAFHLSKNPDDQSALMMLRSYSGTKSITALDVTDRRAALRHYKIGDQKLLPFEKELELV